MGDGFDAEHPVLQREAPPRNDGADGFVQPPPYSRLCAGHLILLAVINPMGSFYMHEYICIQLMKYEVNVGYFMMSTYTLQFPNSYAHPTQPYPILYPSLPYSSIIGRLEECPALAPK